MGVSRILFLKDVLSNAFFYALANDLNDLNEELFKDVVLLPSLFTILVALFLRPCSGIVSAAILLFLGVLRPLFAKGPILDTA